MAEFQQTGYYRLDYMMFETDDAITHQPGGIMSVTDRKSKIRWRVILVFLSLYLGIVFLGLLYYGNQVKENRADDALLLNSMVNSKINQIGYWREERLHDALLIHEDGLFAAEVKDWLEGNETERRKKEIFRRLAALRQNVYEGVVLLDPAGNVKFSIPELDQALLPSIRHAHGEAMRTKEFVFIDFHRIPPSNKINLSLAVPIHFHEDGGGQTDVGVVVLQMNPGQVIYPLLKEEWPIPIKTGELLLVEPARDGGWVYLNDLPDRPNFALTKRVSSEDLENICDQAAKAHPTVQVVTDYKGVEVLAIGKSIPGSPWILIAQIDLDEVTRSHSEVFRLLGFFLVAMFTIMSIGVAYVWRWQEMLAYRRQYEVERSRLAMAKRYEYLTKYAYDVIVIMDRDWHVIEANDRAMETYGYAQDEFYNLHLRDFYPEGKRSANETRLSEMEAARGLTFETVHVRKNGETFPVEVSSSVLVIENEQFFQHIIRDISDRKRRETILEESEKQLRRLSSQLLIVQENERRRISKELHDELGQALMVLKFRLDSLKAGLRGDDPKFDEEFRSIFGYIQEMTAMVRKLCWDLSPANLDDLGLSSALQNMLDEFSERFAVEWHPNNLPLDELFSRLARVNIFRIFQEALTNIGRHALATRILIDVGEEDGLVTFSISDDGKGFDVANIGDGETREMGIGLASMRERARSSGGTLDIWSQPGVGTKITFKIPTKMED